VDDVYTGTLQFIHCRCDVTGLQLDAGDEIILDIGKDRCVHWLRLGGNLIRNVGFFQGARSASGIGSCRARPSPPD
jgi:hypothetical protein